MIGLDKTGSLEGAISRITDGSVVMIGGFGVPGTPFRLIQELVRHGPRDLTIVKNDSNEAGMGVDWLLQAGMIAKLITSHIGLNTNAVRMMNAGEIDVEFMAQGILAERIRTAGAGLMGFVTDIGAGTPLCEGKTQIKIGGETYFQSTRRYLRRRAKRIRIEDSQQKGSSICSFSSSPL